MAKGPEGRFWQALRPRMARAWHAQRLEDAYSPSIPDLSWAAQGTEGFIELKALDSWPARRLNLRRSCHLSEGQVEWLEARGQAGTGRCFILLRAGRLHLLWHWKQARRLLESLPVAEALDLVFRDPAHVLRPHWNRPTGLLGSWSGPIVVEELIALITGPAAGRK